MSSQMMTYMQCVFLDVVARSPSRRYWTFGLGDSRFYGINESGDTILRVEMG